MVNRREAELSNLARSIVGAVDNGSPWDDCDHADLVACLEAFTGAARDALKIKSKPPRRRAVLRVRAGRVGLVWMDRGVQITIKDEDADETRIYSGSLKAGKGDRTIKGGR